MNFYNGILYDADKSHTRYPMEIKHKQLHEMVESKEAKLQVETAAEFDVNENPESQQTQQHMAQQAQVQQPLVAIKPAENTVPAAVQHHDHDSEPKISHAQVHDISHGEPVILKYKILNIIFKKMIDLTNRVLFLRHSSPERTSIGTQEMFT